MYIKKERYSINNIKLFVKICLKDFATCLYCNGRIVALSLDSMHISIYQDYKERSPQIN